MIQNNTLCEMAQAVLWIYPVKSVSILKLEEKLAIIKVKEGGIFMDHVVLEIDLHLINNIRVIYYVVSNSVEQRVLTNKINGILAKKDVHRFNNGEGSYYSIPVEKLFIRQSKSEKI